MKKIFPTFQSTKLKSILDKIKFLQKKTNSQHLAFPHQSLQKKHNINTQHYLDKFSILINKQSSK